MTTIKPDLIISWPKNNDYPLWRAMIRGNRHQVGRIFVVFTETNDGTDYSDFVKSAMEKDGIDFIQQPEVRDKDWRDVAINEALRHSRSEWVWFTEQDFFTLEGFWADIDQFIGRVDVIAAYQAERMHPCCIFMNRQQLDRTHKNFGIVPGISDHFSRIQTDIEQMGMRVAKVAPELYHHMNGLSHNFTLLTRGEQPNYEPEIFKHYLRRCLMAGVPINEQWRALVENYV